MRDPCYNNIRLTVSATERSFDARLRAATARLDPTFRRCISFSLSLSPWGAFDYFSHGDSASRGPAGNRRRKPGTSVRSPQRRAYKFGVNTYGGQRRLCPLVSGETARFIERSLDPASSCRQFRGVCRRGLLICEENVSSD